MADIEVIYRRYGPMVVRRCRRLLGSDEWAVDAMHDVFEKLLRRGQALEDRGLSSYLHRSATHVCLNHIRTRRRRPEGPDSELIEAIAGAEAATDRRISARLLLQRLFSSQPASSQTIAVLHLVDGMTLEEVAVEVDMSVSGVRKRLRKLRAELRSRSGIEIDERGNDSSEERDPNGEEVAS